MKKLFIFIAIFISMLVSFAPKAFAEDLFKITSANFDTSNSMIVLTAQDTPGNGIMKSLKLVKMDNPTRAYFDIDDTIITMPKQDWTFTSGPIKQVKINQFSTTPNKVRVVMYFDNDFNIDNVKFFKVKNNIVIKFTQNNTCNENYLQNTYRDEHSSSSDFYEYTTVMVPAETTQQGDMVGQIQEAFNATTEAIQNNIVKKELKLNTKYYLNNATPKENQILLNGFGAVALERPYILSNPTRIVYDLPNTLTDSKIRNKEFKLNETDTVKIGQFAVNKARIVITSENAGDYIPVYSNDNQSLILANMNKVNYQTLITTGSNVIGYSKEKNDEQTSSMVLFFDSPIVHAVDRANSKFDLFIYNLSKYSEDRFKSTFAGTPFAKAQLTLLPKVGLKISIPLEQDSVVNTYLGADGRTLKVKIKEPKKKTVVAVIPPAASVITPKPTGSGKKKVVIDAGHGGSDSGAIGGGIYEKDITLDVSERVRDILAKQGFIVQMTRANDSYVSLQDRVAISEKFDPDIFVSIHVNSSVRPEIKGVETHYYHQESMALAQTVHSSFASAVNSPNRGLFKSKFYVINHTTAPSILVEIGFISNNAERAELVSEKRKQATAKAIADGVQEYFKQYR